jgi:hypothetical protein
VPYSETAYISQRTIWLALAAYAIHILEEFVFDWRNRVRAVIGAARRVERLLTDKSFRLGGTVAGGLENESTVDHSGNAVVRTLPLSLDARRAGTSWAFKQTI